MQLEKRHGQPAVCLQKCSFKNARNNHFIPVNENGLDIDASFRVFESIRGLYKIQVTTCLRSMACFNLIHCTFFTWTLRVSPGFLCSMLKQFRDRRLNTHKWLLNPQERQWQLKPRFRQAVQISSVRYILEGFFLCFHDQKMWMVPTDPFRTILFVRHPSLEVP